MSDPGPDLPSDAEIPGITAKHAFARGFLIRVLYGALGLLGMVLVRPSFLGEELQLLVLSIGAYLLVCLAGGVADAVAGNRRELFPKRWPVRSTLALVLYGVLLLALWQR